MRTLDQIREYNISVILLALCCFFGGLVCGFLLSPVKKGMTIGCNNGNISKNTGCSAAGSDTDEDCTGIQC
ncbi:MAG: hypothetical protein IJ874_06700 [Ruminococcus sp.]|nr:hypothetical protein [Ruminococcus sp.]